MSLNKQIWDTNTYKCVENGQDMILVAGRETWNKEKLEQENSSIMRNGLCRESMKQRLTMRDIMIVVSVLMKMMRQYE